MKIIITGDPEISDYLLLNNVIAAAPVVVSEVITGTESDFDHMVERWARENDLPIKYFSGKLAHKRMCDYGETLIVITDGNKNIKHLIEAARKKGIDRYIARIQHNII